MGADGTLVTAEETQDTGAQDTGAQDPGQTQDGGGAGDAPWFESLGLEPEHVTDKVKQFKTPAELVRSYNEAQRLLGKKGLQQPGPDAPQEDWDAFWARVGRPETPDGYEFQAPEGIELDDERLGEVRAALHAAGLTPKQFEAVMGVYTEEVQRGAQGIAEQQAAMREASERTLREQWGDQFDDRLAKANAAIRAAGLSQQVLDMGLGNSAEVLQMFDKLAPLLTESGLVDGERGGGTAGQAQERIREIRDELMSGKYKETDATYRRLAQEMEGLYARLYPGRASSLQVGG